MELKSLRPLAFFLPQFHPIPENDAWWGKGFTEWTNVTKCEPRFVGHYQPHLPADLGFYDLRLTESRIAQAEMARAYGIHGFCYYHYWFNGKRVLERPVNDLLASGKPDFPFCLCWANENWTRAWDGEEREVLLKQSYSEADDRAHIQSLLSTFSDPRYIKVNGRPFFLIYRIGNLPNPSRTIEIWREAVAAAGFPGLYLANVESFPQDHGAAAQLPLDAAVEFAPDWSCLPSPIRKTRRFWQNQATEVYSSNRVMAYAELANKMASKPASDYLRYRCVTPMWDNSARRKESASIFVGSTPELYGDWLGKTVTAFTPPSTEENFVFINAWNEWAEGNHLEPCQRWGRAYLEATRKALESQR
jgi:lipopolysaccharide biosynthesis protein